MNSEIVLPKRAKTIWHNQLLAMIKLSTLLEATTRIFKIAMQWNFFLYQRKG